MTKEKKTAAKKKVSSKQLDGIYNKLLAFQQAGVSIEKNKSNPHFKNKYADINEILHKVKPELSKLNIVMVQVPTEEGLKTILHDTDSGESVEGYMKFTQVSDPQKLGSNITYYRRYSLVALLGLEDEDDDGNAATTKAAPARQVTREVTEQDAYKMLRGAVSQQQLIAIYSKLPDQLKNDPEVIGVASEVKQQLINQEEVIE